MTSLEELLSIVDRRERQEALVRYAISLGVDVSEARQKAGEYNEQKLAILIYDALHNKSKKRSYDVRFVFLGVVLLAAGVTFLLSLPKFMIQLFNDQSGVSTNDGKVLKAYDAQGKPLVQGGQPVLFELMDGVYKDYDEKGRVTSESLYRQGKLISVKKIDARGKVINIQNFP